MFVWVIYGMNSLWFDHLDPYRRQLLWILRSLSLNFDLQTIVTSLSLLLLFYELMELFFMYGGERDIIMDFWNFCQYSPLVTFWSNTPLLWYFVLDKISIIWWLCEAHHFLELHEFVCVQLIIVVTRVVQWCNWHVSLWFEYLSVDYFVYVRVIGIKIG